MVGVNINVLVVRVHTCKKKRGDERMREGKESRRMQSLNSYIESTHTT